MSLLLIGSRTRLCGTDVIIFFYSLSLSHLCIVCARVPCTVYLTIFVLPTFLVNGSSVVVGKGSHCVYIQSFVIGMRRGWWKPKLGLPDLKIAQNVSFKFQNTVCA